MKFVNASCDVCAVYMYDEGNFVKEEKTLDVAKDSGAENAMANSQNVKREKLKHRRSISEASGLPEFTGPELSFSSIQQNLNNQMASATANWERGNHQRGKKALVTLQKIACEVTGEKDLRSAASVLAASKSEGSEERLATLLDPKRARRYAQ